MNSNLQLQQIFLKILIVLSEHSVLMCRAMSTLFKGYSHTILQLLTIYVTNETAKVKHSINNILQLEMSLYVISNCCSCIEGRLQLAKVSFFFIYLTLYNIY